MTTALIGGLVGPIGGRTGESVAAVDDIGQGVDFAIGGLGFKMAISDQRPYERATAQFKKDQFDSAPQPGEQGLTGWWLRSQQSFHKGAGLKYYEVLDGETVLNRYASADGLDCRTPGQVTLLPAFNEVLTSPSTGYKRVVTIPRLPAGSGTTEGVYYIKGSTFNFVPYPFPAAPAAITTVGTVNFAQHLATDGRARVWITTASTPRIEVGGGSVATTEVYSHTNNLTGLWYEKGRLWALDDQGSLFAVAAKVAGPSAPLGTALGVVPGASEASLTASPANVYVARDNRVYRVSLAEDGTVPAFAAPVVAAELPRSEVVTAIRYYLGVMVATTSRGFRVAEVADNGGLTFGALLKVLDYSSYCYQLATLGSKVYLTAQSEVGSSDASLYSIDLSQPVGDQVGSYAWTEEHRFNTSGLADGGGVTELYDGVVVWGSVSGLWHTEGSALLPSGSLTTGYHRFGTLEPKKFHSVAIRVGGDGGTVGVSRVMDDGSVIDLYTVDVATSNAEDITLGLDAPQTRLALKFTLTRSGTDPSVGPELLGYQLRALPAPRRQRMIRVPLEVFDMERARGARSTGRVGEAWARLEALEDMERSGGTFQFKDFRTGEAGECFIESVEHQGKTPPGRGDPAFGGIVYVTLRKL